MTTPSLAMLNTPEIILILVLALVLFGAKKLPELARGLGHGIKEFKKATRDVQDELHTAMNAEPPPAPYQPTPTAPAPASAPNPEQAPPHPMGTPPAATVPHSEPPKA
jgi:sec-independent protein translocase protein TatA